MGRQVNFYITKDEEEELYNLLLNEGYKAFGKRSEVAMPLEVKFSTIEELGFVYFTTNTDLLKIKGNEETGYIVDLLRSYCVEYSSPKLFKDKKYIGRGRIWYENKTLVDNIVENEERNEVIENLFRIMSNYIKRICKKDPKSFYISKSVYEDIYDLIHKENYKIY